MKDPLARLLRMITTNDADYMKARRKLPPPGEDSRRDLDKMIDKVAGALYELLFEEPFPGWE